MNKELTDHNYWISKLHKHGKTLGYDTVREIAELIADECYETFGLTPARDELEEQNRKLKAHIDGIRILNESLLEGLGYFQGAK